MPRKAKTVLSPLPDSKVFLIRCRESITGFREFHSIPSVGDGLTIDDQTMEVLGVTCFDPKFSSNYMVMPGLILRKKSGLKVLYHA